MQAPMIFVRVFMARGPQRVTLSPAMAYPSTQLAILIICFLLLGVFTLFPPLDGVVPTLSAYQSPTGCHFTSQTFVFCVTLHSLSSHKSVAIPPSEVSTVVRTDSWSLLLYIMIPHALRVLACACLQTPVCSLGCICGSAAS